MARADLYFIRNPVTGFIKIGITTDLDRRLRELRMASGCAVELIRIVPDAAAFEKPLHEAFAEARLIGEWFTATPELLALARGEVSIDSCISRVDAAAAERLAVVQAELARVLAERANEELRRALEERQERERLAAEQSEWRRRSEAAAARSGDLPITAAITSESPAIPANEVTL